MQPSTKGTRSRPARRAGALLLVLALSSCSALAPDGREITLVNASSRPLFHAAYELQLAQLVDPNPSFPVDPDDERIVAPGATARISPEDVRRYQWGDDVRFFLWTVDGGEAHLRAMITRTHAELMLTRFAVEVTDQVLDKWKRRDGS